MKVNCNEEGIKKANKVIKRGGIAIFPTDTVYGIGCDPYNEKSVEKIYEIKSRNIAKPFPVLAHSIETASKVCHIDEFTKKIAQKFWPGALTIILKITDENLKKSLKLKDKIAIRVPNHRCTLKLLEQCNFLVGTSANVSGHSPYTDPNKCFKDLQDYDVFINGGMTASQTVSTIIEIENEEIKIVREGSLSKKEISKL
jgi:L-threonylcarbamoyladenylate synthase